MKLQTVDGREGELRIVNADPLDGWVLLGVGGSRVRLTATELRDAERALNEIQDATGVDLALGDSGCGQACAVDDWWERVLEQLDREWKGE